MVRLGGPSARLDIGFTEIVSIEELSDGRVVIADRREQRLVVADLSSGTIENVGRIGQGPGEYLSVKALFPVRNDSSLMVDWRQRRWLVLRDDRIVGTVSTGSPLYAAAGGSLEGADSLGSLLVRASLPLVPGVQAALSDSATLLLVDSRTAVARPVVRLKPGPGSQSAEFDDSGQLMRFVWRNPVLAVDEQALLFQDGWLAVVRLDPYRVDWRTPRGEWLKGAPLPFSARPMSEADKQAYRRYMTAIGQSISAEPDWPEAAPPFLPSIRHPSVVVAGPGGLLLIARVPTADRFETHYDVVDRGGTVLAQLVLPIDQRIVSFGSRGVYVVRTTELGLQYVQRHPLPRLP